MTLNVLVKGIKKVERKMLVLLTTETVGKYCESLFQSYLLGNSTVMEVQIRQQIQSYVDPLRCNFLN